MILGIDEAGRGPWAGPLVVGAVVLGGIPIEGLTDSKKLSKKKREVIYNEITTKAAAYSSGWVSAEELDSVGMSEALQLATRRAVEQINVPYSEIIIDGTINFLKSTNKGRYVQTMAKADLLIPSVSAASIVAKVERDRYMATLDDMYPGYGFERHAGYGVARHREAIELRGVTAEHRLSFAPLSKYKLAQLQPVRTTNISLGEVDYQTEHGTRPTTKSVGDAAEEVVVTYLCQNGHSILERNWRTKLCEIDIISKKDDTVYFVEVKYRRNDVAGGGMAAITPRKLKQMTFAAEFYAAKHIREGEDLRLAAADVTGATPVLREFLKIG
jgi:ribonuclease HII